MAYHTPVLLKESIEGLKIKPNGVYVDLTFGGGGHSKEIIKNLKKGKLFAFDLDSDAEKNVFNDSKFKFINQNFRFFKNYLRYYNQYQVDGIIADLGVSSHHFDSKERGFSFRNDGMLDMRMNKLMSLTASDIVNTYSEDQLTKIFYEYGELKNSRKIAKLVVEKREGNKVHTIYQFLKLIKPLIPIKNENKFLAKVFQALRIEVNKEIENLKQMLVQIPDALNPGGRFVVITYHSLEDRNVKVFLKNESFDNEEINAIYGFKEKKLNLVNKKVIIPSEDEIKKNSRARSAKLRIAEKNIE